MSVYGSRCLGPQGRAEGCLGKMGYEYGEKKLYNQLLYWSGLWDVEKQKAKAKEVRSGQPSGGVDGDGSVNGVGLKERVAVVAEGNKVLCETVKGVVDAYLRKCGRQWVDMHRIFGFAGTS